MLELQTSLIFWVIVSFGIMVLVLAKFAFPPLVKVLEDREKKIRESIEQAEQIKADAEQLMKDYEEKLAEARAEAQKIIADNKELGEQIRAEIVQKSEEEAKRMIAKAEEQINLEV
ncbi:MAG: F0F1 ATP synthase subunit B [Rubrobacteridae bacterium]|nr:F0F1 ATP synthase subunit B [Rubrobacteridae bacterium]